MSMNCWNGMGRLTKDPELKYTPSGVAVVTFSIAVDRDYTNKDTGERDVDFIDIVAWRGTAEFVSKYFGKGQMMGVQGKLQARNYTDKEGIDRRKYEIIADTCYFGGDNRKSSNLDESDYSQVPPTSEGDSQIPQGFADLDDEDIPF